ncbi:uncharacterized protein V6R79_001550 [Siganus canaliculatus]
MYHSLPTQKISTAVHGFCPTTSATDLSWTELSKWCESAIWTVGSSSGCQKTVDERDLPEKIKAAQGGALASLFCSSIRRVPRDSRAGKPLNREFERKERRCVEVCPERGAEGKASQVQA